MTVTKQIEGNPPWLLLVFSLARKGASLRVAVWRKLQRYGALPLGNSGYLLPHTSENRERFEWLATAVRTERGEASVLEVQSIDNCSFPQMKQRFSEARAGDYRELLAELRKLSTSANLSSRIPRLRQRFQDIVSIDFFRNPLREQVERALNVMQNSQTKLVLPEIGSVSQAEYRNRVWVTRPRPGVDRVTSAWLIRKFIDPKAKFAFAPEDRKPAKAVPFDMYEGGFGHRGEDCTFETLLKVFHIRDKKIPVMAEIVHDADLFDEKFGRKEGFGIDEVMKGWAQQGLSDHELLKRGMQLAEGLYKSLR
ncbi:MAG TPA: chromate resistance protein ChrB domain-containing protein [Terriglobales bacterium]|nr:chromate resistance protein ChrB domain-containing protein [Terriglobales bacterium]